MAVYKLFPEKDATLYSAYRGMNTGVDAILEVSNLVPDTSPTPRASRALIKFNQAEIEDVLTNRVDTANWSGSLKLYIAQAQGISLDTTLEIYKVSGSWNNGTGQYLDSPITTDGVSWGYRNSTGSLSWSTSGGDYYTGSLITQSFSIRSDKDLNVNVTSYIQDWYDSTTPNDGFLIKLTGSQELNSSKSTQPQLQYYSVDTNTIYPPVLEIKWRDFTYNPGNLNVINNEDIFIALDNNPGIFYSESINRFRLNVRPSFPARTFKTSSLYTSNYALPLASYYAIKDLDTNEYIVDFDDEFTKISCDSNGSYFDVYMNGFEPERNYKILIKTTIGNNTFVQDQDYIFKVING